MLLNNALLNYSSPEGQVLVCTARCEGTDGGGTEPFQDFQVGESNTFQYEKIKVSENVLYFTGYNQGRMGESPTVCKGWQVFRLH